MTTLTPNDPASAIAEIRLGALRHNLDVLRDRAAGLDIMAVVKADAYGHGAARVSRFLADEGVTSFAVATLEEALALRASGLEHRILVFAAPVPEQLDHYARHDLEVTVTSPEVADAVIDTARRVGKLRVHVKVDTGMGRIGLAPGRTVDVIRRLERAASVEIAGIWTHFATSDEPGDPWVHEQWRRFREVVTQLGSFPAPLHAANSGGLLCNPVAIDPGVVTTVRLGIALYGLYGSLGPLPDPLGPGPGPGRGPVPEPEPGLGLLTVMRFVTRLTHVKTVAAGTPISYGLSWRAPRETRIGTISVGYADGYGRRLSNRGEVGIGGSRCAVAGRVCMDMTMIDLGLAGEGPAARVGDEVVLFGDGGPSPFEVARWAETITYEIVCGISARVARRYVDPTRSPSVEGL